jgi:putative Holliday junction resolvase
VAVSDPTGLLARPLKTITQRDRGLLLKEILEICRDLEVETLLVGIPLRGDGSPGTLVPEIEDFISALEKRGLKVIRWSEEFSSVRALDILHRQGKRLKKNKARIDGLAAAILLQEYLDQ